MRDDRRYFMRWMSGILMLLLLLSCSKSSSEGGDEPDPDKPMLKIYVFPPDQPIVTRADNLGNVDASSEENKIHNLHVWVFKRAEGNLANSLLVGYVSLNNFTLSEAGNGEVTMEITDAFANEIMTSTTRPRVDVFVAANVTASNCGLSFETLTKKGVTKESELDALFIGSSYFGVSSPVSKVPADGLPMSGVLKDQYISGTSPVFHVGTSDKLANVQLVRAVSKMRFIFCKSTSNLDEVAVKEIKLNGSVLPKEEYLFLTNDFKTVTPKWRIKGSECEDEKTLVSIPSGTEIAKNNSPYSYSYDGKMTGQKYEDLINEGVKNNELSDLGTFYLRESDKALSGTITYAITPVGSTDAKEKPASYSMSISGDFSRNHTWIVYGYFITSGDLDVNMVELKDWVSSETQGEVYNW